MSELISRFKAKLKEIYYETPLPDIIKKLEPKPDPDEVKESFFCKKCEKDLEDLPDDFRDIKLDKTNRVYNLKLKDIPPHQWMAVGTSLRNMAWRDPEYAENSEDEDDPPEPEFLPPPPPQSEYIKNLKHPCVSMNLKNLSWVDLEEVGEFFYDLGWNHQIKHNIDDHATLDAQQREFHRCDECPTSDESDFEEVLFDPIERIKEEITEVVRITNSDVIPGLEKVPYKDDAEVWLEHEGPVKPPWNSGPVEDFPSPGKIFPLQSKLD